MEKMKCSYDDYFCLFIKFWKYVFIIIIPIFVVISIAVTVVTWIFYTYGIQWKAGLTVLSALINHQSHPLRNWG